MVYEVLPRELFADLDSLQVITENVVVNWMREENADVNWMR
jgi:hypothetical protein